MKPLFSAVLLSAFLLPVSGFAWPGSFSVSTNENLYFVGAGVLTYNAGKNLSDAISGTKIFGEEKYTQLTLMALFPITNDWSFSPDLHYTIPSKKSPEGNQTTSILALGFRGVYRLNPSFDLHIGPGLLFYKITGSGGTVKLSNGNGTTDFATPSGNSTSRVVYWDLGAGFTYEKFRLEGGVLVSSIFDSKKRQYSPLLTASWEVY